MAVSQHLTCYLKDGLRSPKFCYGTDKKMHIPYLFTWKTAWRKLDRLSGARPIPGRRLGSRPRLTIICTMNKLIIKLLDHPGTTLRSSDPRLFFRNVVPVFLIRMFLSVFRIRKILIRIRNILIRIRILGLLLWITDPDPALFGNDFFLIFFFCRFLTVGTQKSDIKDTMPARCQKSVEIMIYLNFSLL
jgi:hypothetical protein